MSARYDQPSERQDKGTQSGYSSTGDLLVGESHFLSGSILIYQFTGRILFSAAIFLRYLVVENQVHPYIIVLYSIVLGTIWFCGSVIASERQRFISKLIAEAEFEENPTRVSPFIRAYHWRYQEPAGQLSTIFIFGEPVLWTAIALVAALSR
jgi:hypothetical protein